ncbi:ABC transporter ATP-binding protein [Corynebacterium ulceribovis]|uniref:ABC transporter ATP-binding protein n=1 Tax=Corynebacterium ulceribovis TaxID=487732 RepID=UPI0003819FBE|nr:ATP-binding cassette domain-containing protein [Corynebacterium ulceribovis]
MMHVELSNVTVRPAGSRHQAAHRPALFTHGTLSIQPGETVALLGMSGVGKSTLARMLLGHMPPGLAHVAGSVQVGGIDPFALRPQQLRQFRRRCCFIDQDPGAALPPNQRVRQLLRHRAQLAGVEAPSDSAALALLMELGLPAELELLDRFPAELSGGQRRRVGIAAGIVAQSELLIIDEPTAGIDAEAKRRVLAAVSAGLKSAGATGLVITHDTAAAYALADRVVRLTADGTSELSPPTQRRSPRRPSPCQSSPRPAPSTPLGSTPVAPESSTAPPPLLQVAKLQVMRSTRMLFDELGFDVGVGELVALTGASGAGKTSVLQAIAGLVGQQSVSGTLMVNGDSVPWQLRQRTARLRRQFAWIPQETELALNPSVRVGQLLRRSGARDPEIAELMAALRITGLEGSLPDELSGGQRQRVCVAAELLRRRPILLCDEPTAALDDENAAAVIGLLREYAAQGAVLVASHDARLLAAADRKIAVGAEAATHEI